MHDLLCAETAQIDALFNQASQVAIGKNAQYLSRFINDGRRTQTFAAHLAHQITEARVRSDSGHGLARAHHVAHVRKQFAPKCTARMRACEILRLETARIQQRHRQCVPQSELRRGAGGGRQIQRTGFFLDRAIQK